MTAFWDKIKGEKKEDASAKADEKRSSQPVKKDAKPKKAAKVVKEKAELFNNVLDKPVISENAMNQQLIGKYVFRVNSRSSKNEVSKAVEAKYGVVVAQVNTVRYKPKTRGFRSTQGQMKGYKKAIVTVRQGDKIELFKEA